MKKRAGQAARVAGEILHGLGRAGLLLMMLAFLVIGGLGYGLSKGPVQIPWLASRLATQLSGEGITVHMDKAELSWEGWYNGGSPFRLHLAGIMVRDGAGLELAQVPEASLALPPADLLGGTVPLTVAGKGATIPAASVPVSWHATVWPGGGFTLSRARIFVTLGAGVLGQGGMKVAIAGGAFTLNISPGVAEVTDGQATLPHVGQSAPNIGFTLDAKRQGDWQGKLTVTADSVRAQDIGAYWPPEALKSTRGWVVSHITGGVAQDAAFNFFLAAPGNLSSLSLSNVTGRFTGNDLTLIWLLGVTPLTHLNGSFVMPDQDTALITASAAEDAGIAVTHGQMTISGMSQPDQEADLALDLAGPVPDVLNLLAEKPLSLLSGAPSVLMGATGRAAGTFTAQFPLEKTLALTDIQLRADTMLHDFSMQSPSVPLSFSQGELHLVTDGKTLQVNGGILFAGEPSTLKLAEDFAPPGRQTMSLTGEAGPQVWKAFGLDGGVLRISGTAPFTFQLQGPAEGTQHAETNADLTGTQIAMPDFAWSKAPGMPGTVTAALTLKNGDVTGVNAFTAAAPAFTVQGVGENGGFRLDPVRIGRTQASGTLTPPGRPGGAWTANFTGPVLDLRPGGGARPGQGAATPAAEPPASGPPWVASLQFGTLYLAAAPAPPLTGFSFSGDGEGDEVRHAQANAAEGITLTIMPQIDGRHGVTLNAEDAGQFLSALGTYDGMRGGGLALDASYGGDQPAAGSLHLDDARLMNAPVATKVLEGLTLYGVAEAVSGPGLEINHAVVPFTLRNGTLTLKQARAYSASLGFTASGDIGLSDQTLALDSTIVPAYAINALPGRIPLIGHLFSAEKGGGLIAMRAHVSGTFDKPKVSFNPLSALTPGFLRGIFGLGEAKTPQAPSTPQPSPDAAGGH